MGGLGLLLRRRAIQAHPTQGESKYILADGVGDAEVFRILMTKNISSDGIGITKDDAAKVTSIGTWFKGNKLIEDLNCLRYFSSMTALSSYAFEGCTSLKVVAAPSVVTIGGSAFNGCSSLEAVDISGATSIGSYAFLNCSLLADLLINEDVLTIGTRAFYNCTSLTGDYIFNSLSGALSGESFALTNINSFVAHNITSVAGSAFSGCAAITLVDIGAVISFGYGVFINCKALQSLIIRATTPPTFGSAMLNNTTCNIYVPNEAVEDYKATSGWSSFASRIKPLSEYQG